MTQMKKSFDNEETRDRFVGYAFKENPNISNFRQFEKGIGDAFNTMRGENAKLSNEDVIGLFESPECKKRIGENVSSEDYEKLYGDGIIVRREAVSPKKVITIVTNKRVSKSYQRKGKQIKGYSRTYNRWEKSQERFIKVRVEKKISTSQIFQEYNQHFKSSPKTKSSIQTKSSRLRKSFNR